MNEKECAIFCTCTVKVTGKTGVEMEALTGVSAALLTITICVKHWIRRWRLPISVF